jgi:hypothetical protein
VGGVGIAATGVRRRDGRHTQPRQHGPALHHAAPNIHTFTRAQSIQYASARDHGDFVALIHRSADQVTHSDRGICLTVTNAHGSSATGLRTGLAISRQRHNLRSRNELYHGLEGDQYWHFGLGRLQCGTRVPGRSQAGCRTCGASSGECGAWGFARPERGDEGPTRGYHVHDALEPAKRRYLLLPAELVVLRERRRRVNRRSAAIGDGDGGYLVWRVLCVRPSQRHQPAPASLIHVHSSIEVRFFSKTASRRPRFISRIRKGTNLARRQRGVKPGR